MVTMAVHCGASSYVVYLQVSMMCGLHLDRLSSIINDGQVMLVFYVNICNFSVPGWCIISVSPCSRTNFDAIFVYANHKCSQQCISRLLTFVL